MGALMPRATALIAQNYWYSYAITLPTEITAAAIVIQCPSRSILGDC